MLKTIEIGPNQVGIKYKKVGSKLPPGKQIATNGETGYQAEILPPGTHFYSPWLMEVEIVPAIEIPQGEIGLVVAKDGETKAESYTQNLGRIVPCSDFQDGVAFLANGGEKGEQLGILRAGTYRINTKLFTVITSANAKEHNVNPEDLKVYHIETDMIGIVTTKDGLPIPEGEIAGPCIEDHNKFQDAQAFIDNGGCKGLQEEIIPVGNWYLNPWFVKIEKVPLTVIPTGTVGVVISYVGKTPPCKETTKKDKELKNGEEYLVDKEYKGIHKEPLRPNKYPINTYLQKINLVPTNEIALDWSKKEESQSTAMNYDLNLEPLNLRSKDGFEFYIELTQIIQILPENAPKMIASIVSVNSQGLDLEKVENSKEYIVKPYDRMRNLIKKVLEPNISYYFRSAAQEFKAIDFHSARNTIAQNVKGYIKRSLKSYGIIGVNTLINEIDLPEELEKILTEREIERQKTESYQVKIENEEKRRKLIEQEAFTKQREELIEFQTDRQKKLYESQDNIQIAKNQAQAQWYQDQADAESIQSKIQALGGVHNYFNYLKINNWSNIQLPHVLVNSDGGRSEILEAFVTPMLDTSSNQSQLPSNGEYTQPRLKEALPKCLVVLLIDTSDSMSTEYKEELIKGINKFKEQLSNDPNTNKCIEVAIITFGTPVKTIKPFTDNANYNLTEVELEGSTAIGEGLELALKVIDDRQKIFKEQNIQHYQPWIITIAGSTLDDNWQQSAEKIQEAFAEEKLNFLAIGVEDVDQNILSEICPPKASCTMLEGLKFKPLFFRFAKLMIEIANRYEKDTALEGLAQIVENISSDLPSDKVVVLQEYTARLMSEASKEKITRQEYSQLVKKLFEEARNLGVDAKPILKIVPKITKKMNLN